MGSRRLGLGVVLCSVGGGLVGTVTSVPPVAAATDVIITVATDDPLVTPHGLVVFPTGDLGVSHNSSQVDLIDPDNGDVVRLAGTGTPGFNGDEVPGPSAQLDDPRALTYDNEGNLFIADVGNNRIRRVDRDDLEITTVVGDGTAGTPVPGPDATASPLAPLGGLDHLDGKLYFGSGGDLFSVDLVTGELTLIVASTGGFDYATRAVLARDDDLVVDRSSGRFTAVALDPVSVTNLVDIGWNGSTYNGDWKPLLESRTGDVGGMAQAPDGHVWWSSENFHRVRAFNGDTMTTSSMVGVGTAGHTGDGGNVQSAQLNTPQGLGFNPEGDLFIVDTGNNAIRMVDDPSPPKPAILEVSHDVEALHPAGTMTFTVTLTNAGEIPLHVNRIRNNFVSPDCTHEGLPPIPVGGSLTRECTLRDADEPGAEVSGVIRADSQMTLEVFFPLETEIRQATISATLDAAEASVAPGDTAHFTATLHNTGDVPVNAVTLDDGSLECDDPPSSVAAGEEASVECTHVTEVRDTPAYGPLVTFDTENTEVGGVATDQVAVVIPPHGFSDAPDGVWYEDGLDWAAHVHIVAGFPNNTYRPKDPVNRAQAVSMLWQMNDAPTGALPHGFSDVPADAWYEDALNWAAENEIIAGFPDNTFRPKGPVNRAQFAMMLWNVADGVADSPPHGFTDVPAGVWYEAGLDWVGEFEILTGFPDGTYRPKNSVNRGQAVNALYNLAQTQLAWENPANPPTTVFF